MCPFCLATAAWIAAAAVSTGGMTALVVKRVASSNAVDDSSTITSTIPVIAQTKENHHG